MVNAGGWGVYRVGLRRRTWPGWPGRLPDLDPLERCNLFADTWALVLAGRADLGGFLARWPPSSGDEDEPGDLHGGGRRPRAVRPGGGRRRPAAVAGATQALLGTAGGRSRLGAPARRGRAGTHCGPSCSARSGRSAPIRACGPRRPRRFDAPVGGATPIDPDIEGAVLQSVAAQLRPGDYEAVLDRYRHPATPQEELRYLTALAAFPDVELARRTFELALRPRSGPRTPRTWWRPCSATGSAARRCGSG